MEGHRGICDCIIRQYDSWSKMLHCWFWRWGKGAWTTLFRLWDSRSWLQTRKQILLRSFKRAWLQWHLDFGPVKLISDFWLPELHGNKCTFFRPPCWGWQVTVATDHLLRRRIWLMDPWEVVLMDLLYVCVGGLFSGEDNVTFRMIVQY